MKTQATVVLTSFLEWKQFFGHCCSTVCSCFVRRLASLDHDYQPRCVNCFYKYCSLVKLSQLRGLQIFDDVQMLVEKLRKKGRNVPKFGKILCYTGCNMSIAYDVTVQLLWIFCNRGPNRFSNHLQRRENLATQSNR